jgi:hypothetical protein
MRTKLTVMLGGILAATALTLGVSAEPASAMPRSCLSMYTAYQQATLDSTHADNRWLTFRDGVQQTYPYAGVTWITGSFVDMYGHLQSYDTDLVSWSDALSYFEERAVYYQGIAESALDAYQSDCGY